jgi:hypothetical protein
MEAWMSRLLRRSPLVATFVVGVLTACAVESPVAPTPDTPEDAVLEQRADPDPPGPQHVENEYIVIFREDRQIPPGLVQQLVGDHDLALKHEYEHVLRGFAAKIPPQALAGLRNNPFIERIEPNLTYTLETPGRLASPISVPEDGLRVRLVADDLAPGDVSVWPNRGSDGDAVQPIASRRPTSQAPSAAFGGHAAVGFNEGGDNDEVLEIAGVTPHGSATIVAVVRQEDANRHNYGLATMYGSRTSRASAVTRYKSGGTLRYWDSSSGWSNGTTVLSPGQTYVAVWRVDEGNQVDLQIDGSPAGTDGLAGPIPPFDRYLFGMTEPSTSARFDGWLAEVLVYDRVLNDCERDGIVAGLAASYAVQVPAGFGPCGGDIPAPPTDLQTAATAVDGVDLTWIDTSHDEVGFRIERRDGGSATWAEVGTAIADETAYADAGLDPATEYCYRVSAFNGAGDSDHSNESCATTDAPPPLPAPLVVPTVGLRVRLIANDLSSGEVATWPNRGSETDAVQGDAARRPSFRAPAPEFGGQASVAFNEGADNDEALEVAGVASHGSGTLFAVFRHEDAGSHNYGLFGPWGGGNSRAAMVTAASSAGGKFVYWDSSNGWSQGTATVAPEVTYVGVWRFETGASADLWVNGEPTGATNLGAPVPTFDRYVIGMTEPSTSSRFDGWVAELLFYDRPLPDCELDQIVADLGGRYGVSVASTGGGCAPPADPTDLTATPVSYDAIDLAWTDASSDEDGFRIERALGQNGTWEQIASTGPGVTTYGSRNLIQQTEYCYRVSAFNGDGASNYTDAACAITEPAPPGACVDTGNHDDLSDLYGIAAIGAPSNQAWASTQKPGCEIGPWYFGLDSGVDSDHPDLNVIEALSFVAAEPGHDGEDRNGHGTHTAGSAAARDGNGGVVGVAPGARVHSFRVCEDGGSCQTADMVAAMDAVVARKLDNPTQPMVANMSIGGPTDNVIDEALRNSINAGIVYAVAAGNGILGACIFPGDAANVSPARVGDDEIAPGGGSLGNDGLINGVLTTTSHDASFSDVNCNYGAPVSVAAPGYQIRSTWLNGGYNTISGTSMATPHAAGAALLYLQGYPDASPAEVEAAIVGALKPWSTNETPNASGRLSVEELNPVQTSPNPDDGSDDGGDGDGSSGDTPPGNGKGNGKGKNK